MYKIVDTSEHTVVKVQTYRQASIYKFIYGNRGWRIVINN